MPPWNGFASRSAGFGSFPRLAEDVPPGNDAKLGRDYDPNWRHFIGTALVLVLEKYRTNLTPELITNIEFAIKTAVEGEFRQKRIRPGHTNINLMYAFMLDWAGANFQQEQWSTAGFDLAEVIAPRHQSMNGFDEYNSPTYYYCVNLYALNLWRTFGSSERIRQIGAELERNLWEEIAEQYDPDLRNLVGPHARAYGVDMNSYLSLLGLWLDQIFTPLPETPLPVLSETVTHGHDLLWAPSLLL